MGRPGCLCWAQPDTGRLGALCLFVKLSFYLFFACWHSHMPPAPALRQLLIGLAQITPVIPFVIPLLMLPVKRMDHLIQSSELFTVAAMFAALLLMMLRPSTSRLKTVLMATLAFNATPLAHLLNICQTVSAFLRQFARVILY